MLFQVITENGVKKIKPLTADAGAGNPVGTIIPMYKKSSPSGYLYCDGSTFDETAYPLLYAYLGTNVLPDYREFALVGAEQNTTSSNIADHDIYTEGQEKDDQLQNIEFNMSPEGPASNSLVYGSDTQGFSNLQNIVRTGARVGTVTRGKRKAVYFYIKATSGLSENAQDNVINTLNEQRSYSTEEHLTGKKWIDGKPTYSKTFTTTVAILQDYSWGGLQTEIANLHLQTSVFAQAVGTSGETFPIVFVPSSGFKCFALTGLGIGGNITLEYTKTTD